MFNQKNGSIMKKTLFLLSTALFLSSPTIAQAESVLATVNGEKITQEQVQEFFDKSPAASRGLNIEDLQETIVDQLITTTLIDKAIKENKFAEKKDVKEKLEMARTEILRDLWVEAQIDERLTEDYLRAKYKEMTDKLAEEYEIKARHILVDTKEAAEDVIESLDDGADFAELAKEKSIGPSGKEGGDLGFFTKGAMVPEFSAKAFSLEKGTYTKEPVQTQFGWHVILVEDKRPVEAPAFEDVMPRLKAEQSRAVLQDVFSDLRSKATITRSATSTEEKDSE